MQKQQRLARELSKISKSPPNGISLTQRDNTLNILEAKIIGPASTPYSDGMFNLELVIPEDYPFSPPAIKFVTKIYHPNVDDNGRICLDLIKMPPQGRWQPTITLEGLLIAVRMLLESPNPDDPLMVEIAEELKNNKDEFDRKARHYTEKFAII